MDRVRLAVSPPSPWRLPPKRLSPVRPQHSDRIASVLWQPPESETQLPSQLDRHGGRNMESVQGAAASAWVLGVVSALLLFLRSTY